MKILQIINSLEGGGAERLVTQLASYLNEKNYVCHVIILSKENEIYLKTLINANVSVFISPYNSLFDIRIFFFILKIIKYGKYDIVHAHLFPVIYWTSLVGLFLNKKIKLFMTEHNTFNKRRKKKWLRHIEYFIYKRYDIIISISEGVRDELMKWIEPNKDIESRYITINNGINVIEYVKATPYQRSDFNIPIDTVLLGMIGSFTEQKNHIGLVQAMRYMPENIHIVFAGSGVLEEQIKKITIKYGLAERIHFLGFINDIARLIKMIDIVVIPSLWEGFGLIAAEAMACGKPIAASNVSGLRDVLYNCAEFFNPMITKDIVKSILKLVNDKQYCDVLIKKAISKSKNYDVVTMIDSYVKIYCNKLSVYI